MSAQFFVKLCVQELHTYFETVQVFFPFFPRKGGGGGVSQNSENVCLSFIRYFLEYSVFSLLLEELLKEYSPLTLKMCINWTAKFDVTTFLSLNTENYNIQNYDIFLNTFVDNLI